MRYRGINSRRLLISAILASALGASMGAAAQLPIPDNIGGGLRQLVEAQGNAAAAPSALSAAAVLEPRVLRDAQSRVLVNVWLDGRRPLAAVHQSLAGPVDVDHSAASNGAKCLSRAWHPSARSSGHDKH